MMMIMSRPFGLYKRAAQYYISEVNIRALVDDELMGARRAY